MNDRKKLIEIERQNWRAVRSIQSAPQRKFERAEQALRNEIALAGWTLNEHGTIVELLKSNPEAESREERVAAAWSMLHAIRDSMQFQGGYPVSNSLTLGANLQMLGVWDFVQTGKAFNKRVKRGGDKNAERTAEQREAGRKIAAKMLKRGKPKSEIRDAIMDATGLQKSAAYKIISKISLNPPSTN